jgi:adenosylcobinamide-GDP ribazoletransferase
MNKFPDTFIFAIQFLTRLRLGKHLNYQPELAGAAVAWYAPVGLLIGCVLALTGWMMTDWFQLSPFLVAALVLAVWVVITGALHLDGVGDCGDAWMGGHTPERMLEIMKDTKCGIGAIVSVGMILLIKFSALALLVAQDDWQLLIFAPVMGRAILTLVLLYVPYVRPEGLAAFVQSHLDSKLVIGIGLLLSFALTLIWFQGFLYALIASMVGYLIIHLSLIKPLKGATGDIYGTVLEVTETAVLIGLVAAL